jgi:hypothetical protein
LFGFDSWRVFVTLLELKITNVQLGSWKNIFYPNFNVSLYTTRGESPLAPPPLLTRMHAASSCSRWLQQVAMQKDTTPDLLLNIQMQHLQHMPEGRWNTWNMHLKH